MPAFHVTTEYGHLAHVVMGTGRGYHRDPAQVEVLNSTHAATLGNQGHPDAAAVQADFDTFRAAMQAAGVNVYEPVLAPPSVQDQTCPRDIGFVIGESFVTAGMRSHTRTEEITAIDHILADFSGPRLTVPDGMALEGGDVIVDGTCVFVGAGQRSDPDAIAFLTTHFPDHQIIPLPTKPSEDILHLDCTFQPLGLGHALIYPAGLDTHPDPLRAYDWIEVTKDESIALATNILSVAPDHIIARNAPACARVNAELRSAGYTVTEVAFDAVPSTGGSFRCATLPLLRS